MGIVHQWVVRKNIWLVVCMCAWLEGEVGNKPGTCSELKESIEELVQMSFIIMANDNQLKLTEVN